MRETFERWLDDGESWIGIFENHAMDSAGLGHRVAMVFNASQYCSPETTIGAAVTFIGGVHNLPEVVVNRTTAPSAIAPVTLEGCDAMYPEIGTGWKYILIAQALTVDAAMDAMGRNDEEE